MTVATYVDKRLGSVSVLELHRDYLVIKGSRLFGSRFEIKVALEELDPNFARYWVRDPHPRNVSAAFCLPLFCLSLLLPLALGPHLSRVPVFVIAGVPLTLLVAPLLIGIIPIRFESRVFSLRSGVVSFALRKVGPGAASFDVFTEQLLQGIDQSYRAARKGTGPGPE